ncbi:bone morphogenetic protein 10-like [Hemiscyllium ocellatum]|uniref:bone morphogenetic protein 10-like n=1 Tax=Hemiscyllium ocellatum TaxID=170820 RepID=UPI002966B268|nr:bone morphogenetic protein 10-like [Hemiscyllium ocellatum]
MPCSTWFAVLSSLSFFLQVATCKPLAGWNLSTEGEGSQNSHREGVLDEDVGFDFNAFLQSVKDELLRTLNLSDIPTQEPLKVEPPQFMIDLYNRFATDRSAMPSSNIVRSFRDEGTTSTLPAGESEVRRHVLVFNISIPRHEEVTMAELRLHTFVERDRRQYGGEDRTVTVYEVLPQTQDSPPPSLLLTKRLGAKDSGCETFEVTGAVKRWIRSGVPSHRLEVQIGGGGAGQGERPEAVGTQSPSSASSPGDTPLLVVFSDDRSHGRREAGDELKELIEKEREALAVGSGSGDQTGDLLRAQAAFPSDTSSRTRRNAKADYCKRSPLHVDFSEIGWDSWIIAPKSYEAYECRGFCHFPLTDHVTPTKHAIIQTLVNRSNPKKAVRACCVPTKLDPISVLYKDDAGVITYKYKYEGMVVAECGCR